MGDMGLLSKLLALIVIANGAPVAARWLLRNHWTRPLDGGWLAPDGHPLFGPSKTVAGMAAAVSASGACAALLGLPATTGVLIGVLAMAGDLGSSFLKRRLGLPAGTDVFLLDQVPEAVLPLLAIAEQFFLSVWDFLLLCVLFTAVELALTRLLRIISGGGA